MPIKIHHGPPGSYKTSGAVQDDLVRQVKEGRVIVTNIRGVSLDRILEVFEAHKLGEVPETCEVISIDTSVKEGRDKLARFFHWAPQGAAFFIDECQSIFPKRWRDADLRALDYPGGYDQAAKDARPANWEDAWDMHRHYNWDWVLTCPDFDKVRDDIKGVADGAYKHKDLGLLGLFWAGYTEGFHSPEHSGASASHFYSVQQKKIKKWVFKLYDSTTTGKTSKTRSGSSLFKNPRILFLLAFLAGCAYFVLSKPLPAVVGGKSHADALQNAVPGGKATGISTSQAPHQIGGGGFIRTADGTRDKGDPLVPFSNAQLTIVGYSKVGVVDRYYLQIDGAPNLVPSTRLLEAGYRLEPLGPCAARFINDQTFLIAVCGAYQRDKQDPQVVGQRPADDRQSSHLGETRQPDPTGLQALSS